MKLLDCAVIGVCAVIRSNTVLRVIHCPWEELSGDSFIIVLFLFLLYCPDTNQVLIGLM